MNVNLCACGTERETERGKWERVWLTWYVGVVGQRVGWGGLTVEKFHTLGERVEQKNHPIIDPSQFHQTENAG